MPGAPPASLPYISVEDLKAATDKAASPGAKVIMPEQEVPARVGSPSSSLSGANVAPWPGK